jgi:hypothetical protein
MRYASILAQFLKVGLHTAKMGVLPDPPSPLTLGSEPYRMLLTAQQIEAGEELLKAKEK